jgi:hypothetical protein
LLDICRKAMNINAQGKKKANKKRDTDVYRRGNKETKE